MTEIFSIKDKVVIITGAARGIGNEISQRLADEGAIIYGIDIKFSRHKRSVEKINQIKCDIRSIKDFQKICNEIYQKHKKIDILINNAGVTFPLKKLGFYNQTYWNKTIDVNLTAAFHCCQSVIKHMLKNRSGSIINITSLNAERAFSLNPAYVASKGGLKMMTKALAKDWGKLGIRVNNLGPGYIRTEMTRKSFENKRLKSEREKQTLLKRWGETVDLIGPCIFLASDASKYITGQDIYVDGGWLANGGI